MSAPSSPVAPPSPVVHPPWSRSASIYEVNIRQFTPEGSFAALQAHLPRLRELGVDILWLMPIQPIGLQNRKGSLGSPYAVRDYTAVNPEFGTLEEFRSLVRAIHAAGMRVIIDWVANHTAWDHPWVSEHPEWYLKNAAGEIDSYAYDNGREIEHWTDVVGLDWRQGALWNAMVDALKFWVRETGIDGYRCDVAGLLPTAFWERARAELDGIRPVFMLAEWSDPALHRAAFDMGYDWGLHDVLRAVAKGEAGAAAVRAHFERRAQAFPADAYHMTFTSNHDKNAWEGHDEEVYGAAFGVCAVLAATLPGMPLIYGGQEAVLDRRLAFFEKDAIDWKTFGRADFYRRLLQIKHANRALDHGSAGGPLEWLETGSDAVLAWRRVRGEHVLTVWANLSAQPQALPAGAPVATLAPWGWCLESRCGTEVTTWS